MSVTELSAFFESKDEGVVYTVSPPEVDISSVHDRVQDYKSEESANEKCFLKTRS